jgi:hypothetical protein
MSNNKHVARAKCPSCSRIIDLERRYKRQELIVCPHCKQILEVVRVFPQILNFPDDPYISYERHNHHRLR